MKRGHVPATLRAIAVHESAHAVAAVLVGTPILDVSVIADGTDDGVCHLDETIFAERAALGVVSRDEIEAQALISGALGNPHPPVRSR